MRRKIHFTYQNYVVGMSLNILNIHYVDDDCIVLEGLNSCRWKMTAAVADVDVCTADDDQNYVQAFDVLGLQGRPLGRPDSFQFAADTDGDHPIQLVSMWVEALSHLVDVSLKRRNPLGTSDP